MAITTGAWGTWSRTPWSYHPISAPIIFAGFIYAIGQGLFLIVDSWLVLNLVAGTLFLGVLGVTALVWKNTELHGPSVVYALLAGLASIASVYALAWSGPYSVLGLVVFGVSVALFWPTYGVVLTGWERAETTHMEAVAAATAVVDEPVLHVWEQIMRQVGRPSVKHVETVPKRDGVYAVHMRASAGGATARSIKNDTPMIEAAASRLLDKPLKRGAINVVGGEYADDIIIIVDTTDILSQVIPYDMSQTQPRSIKDPALLSVLRSGALCELALPGRNILVVGVMGSGKSVALNNLIAQVTACDDALVMLAAGQKAMPLMAPWYKPWLDGKTDRPLIASMATTPEQVMQQLEWVATGIDVRQGSPRGGRDKLEPSPDNPYFLHIVDEAPDLLKGVAQFASKFIDNARAGRSELFNAVLATQGVTTSFMGVADAAIKKVFDTKWGFGMANRGDAIDLFGQLQQDIDFSELAHPGSGLITNKALGEPMLGKTRYLDQVVDVPVLAARHTAWAAEPEKALARAWGDSWARRYEWAAFGENQTRMQRFLMDPKDVVDDEGGPVQVAPKWEPKGESIVTTGELPGQLSLPPLSDEYQAAIAKYEAMQKGEIEPDPEMDQFHLDIEKYLADNASDQQDPAEIDSEALKSDGARSVLQILVKVGPDGMSRKQVIEASGMPVSTVAAYLRMLIETRHVVQVSRGVYRAARFG